MGLHIRKDIKLGKLVKINANKKNPSVRTCPHRVNVRIFRHNFVGDKAKIRRRAVALQGFLTQSPAKFDEKTCMNPYVDRFLLSVAKNSNLLLTARKSPLHYLVQVSPMMPSWTARKRSR